MNQKKVKSLKKLLRSNGVDVKERVYEMNGGAFTEDGKLFSTGTVYLNEKCGRKIYQTLKAKQ